MKTITQINSENKIQKIETAQALKVNGAFEVDFGWNGEHGGVYIYVATDKSQYYYEARFNADGTIEYWYL